MIALFSLYGGVRYAPVIYAPFRMSPAAYAAILLPGALPFLTAIIAGCGSATTVPRHRAALVIVLAGILLGRFVFAEPAIHKQADFGRPVFSPWLIIMGGIYVAA